MDMKIALAGNPNCGKTTLFNALTGSNQYVGNWPGVTVEKKEGKLKGHKDVVIQDLPGIYSLSPYTLEEVVARNYLVGEKPDAILNIVDASRRGSQYDRLGAQERRPDRPEEAGRRLELRGGGNVGAEGRGRHGCRGEGSFSCKAPPGR